MKLYESDMERSSHAEAIESLSEETRLPMEVVREVYERELLHLKVDARIKEFLVVFTMRKTRAALRAPQFQG
jgi:hypothetical protein